MYTRCVTTWWYFPFVGLIDFKNDEIMLFFQWWWFLLNSSWFYVCLMNRCMSIFLLCRSPRFQKCGVFIIFQRCWFLLNSSRFFVVFPRCAPCFFFGWVCELRPCVMRWLMSSVRGFDKWRISCEPPFPILLLEMNNTDVISYFIFILLY